MKERTISAIIMLIIAIPIIFYFNNKIFTVASVIVGLEAAREITKLKQYVPIFLRIFLYVSIIFIGYFSYQYGFLQVDYLVILFLVYTFMFVNTKSIEKFDFEDVSTLLTMSLYIILGLNALITLKVHFASTYFFYPILVALFTDSFGFFGGKLLGKHKLIEEISPKKTVEGAMSATIFALIFSIVYLSMLDYNIETVIIVSIIMVISSQYGDLFASAIKRTYSVKDYGKFIPGHGGVMDRVDSVLYNFIVFSVILMFI